MKRLTLDLPEGLHRTIKRRAVEEGVTMVDMLRTLLEEQYGLGSGILLQCTRIYISPVTLVNSP